MVERYKIGGMTCDEDEVLEEDEEGEVVFYEAYAKLEAENADLKRRLDIAKRELCQILNQDLSDLQSGIDKVFVTFRSRKHHDIVRALQGKEPKEEGSK